MILIGLGANLPSPEHGAPHRTLDAALAALTSMGIGVVKRSPWYETAPIPAADQPWYVNGVAVVKTDLAPPALLTRLHDVEAGFGRVRSAVNAPRVVDLDLLAYGDLVSDGWPILPHPRMTQRAFVLRPLADVAPRWRHPVSGLSAAEHLENVDLAQQTRLFAPPAEQA